MCVRADYGHVDSDRSARACHVTAVGSGAPVSGDAADTMQGGDGYCEGQNTGYQGVGLAAWTCSVFTSHKHAIIKLYHAIKWSRSITTDLYSDFRAMVARGRNEWIKG